MTTAARPLDALGAPAYAALVVHDLKNALGALEGTLEALQTAPTPDDARRAWRQCVALRQRLAGFLVLQEGGSDAVATGVQDESPAALLRRLCDEADPAAGPRPRADDHAAPPWWHYDARLVRLALDAALHNARRHAAAEVRIAVAVRNGWLVWQVEDDGPGLAGGRPSDDATGLGARLCRAVADAHRDGERRGRVVLKDRPAPARGARFELWLP